MTSPDILKATELVVKTLEYFDIPYYIGGSVASSAYGFARATLDVDLIVDLKLNNVHSLVQMLQASYYIDEEMVSDAVRLRSSFNLIHFETMLKIDIFVIKDSLYAREAFNQKKGINWMKSEALSIILPLLRMLLSINWNGFVWVEMSQIDSGRIFLG